jgi:hypothetical protein
MASMAFISVAPSGVESARRVLGLAVERFRWVAEAPRAREEQKIFGGADPVLHSQVFGPLIGSAR